MVYAAVGIVRSNGSFDIPEKGQLGKALGIEGGIYGIRNKSRARTWLTPEIVGIVVASSETGGKPCGVGVWTTDQEEMVGQEFVNRNGGAGPQASGDVHHDTVDRDWVPISQRRDGLIPGGPRDAIAVTQPESELLVRYQTWLGRDLSTRLVNHPGQPSCLQIDAYDEETHTLIEAKSSSERQKVLLAMGQLHDYGRCIKQHQHKLILLPAKPVKDLFELAESLDIEICYEDGNSFVTGF